MFKLKLKGFLLPVAAGAFLAFGGGVLTANSAKALTCPDPAASTVLRLLDISTDPAANETSISCLASGTDATADSAFQNLFPSYSFVGKEENAPLNGNEGIGALDGILDEVGGSSFWGGTVGEFTFTDPGTDDAYAILFKFGQPSLSESWFAIKVAGGLNAFKIIWESVDPDGNRLTQHELSHVSLYAAPIPLPAAGILLISALGGLGFAARRRRKAS